MRFALYTAATRTAIGFLSFSFPALCPHSRVHGQLTPPCPQLPACATNSVHALFLERLLPLLVQMLVAGPLHHSPLFTSKNLIPTTNELGRPMRVKG
jgi:hypothetical protein